MLKDAAAGAVKLAAALKTVARARKYRDAALALLTTLDPDNETGGLPLQERISETVLALEERGGRDSRVGELNTRMEQLTKILAVNFLGE